MSWKPDVMLYHANCADGFGAAWAAWMRWRDDIRYVPASYGQAPPDVAGKHVLIGDFSYPAATIVTMAKTAASVVILDHHKTAESDLQLWTYEREGDPLGADEVPGLLSKLNELLMPSIVAQFDMERSGARMVWEFCHDTAAPFLIDLIEDRDLWRFRHEETKPFALWLRSEPFDFERWELIAQDLGEAREGDRVMAEARAMLRFYDQKVSEMVALARPMKIGGHVVPAVNCPPMFASDVGNALLVKHPAAPFSACYSDQGEARGFSLRSEDARQDVSAIAKRYGGGGHRNAAGFGVPL